MGYNSYINGSIDGISEDSFELIKEDLEDVFGDVYWNNNEIDINSYGKHCDEVVFPVYDKIAFCIDGKGGGRLDIEGDEHDDLSSIFFAQRQWKQVLAEIIYPENPFINKSINIKCSITAYVHVNRSMLDKIKSELDGWANGDENVCITMDDLKSWFNTGYIENKKLSQFFKNVLYETTVNAGDIVFHT